MAKADMAAAVAAAVKETEAEMAGSQPPEAEGEGTAPKAEATPPVEEATPDSQEVGIEVEPVAPSELFGVDLSVLPDDEARAKFVREFTETNKTIGKLQRELAELQKVETPAPTPPLPTEPEIQASSLTDEQLAEALGIDSENSMDPDRDAREIGLARKYLEQEERLARLETATAATQAQSFWDRSLDALEAKFGKLPVERGELVAFAAKEGVASPEAAYWSAVGPVRATVAQALESRLIELRTDAKKQATSPRPKTSANLDENALKATTVKDGIREAFEKARASLGIELSD